MMIKRVVQLFLPLALFLGLLPAASAQVLVYKLKFEETGPSVNYETYDGGFFITSFSGGSGNVILTARKGLFRFYTLVSGGGEFFYVSDRDDRVAVFRAFGSDTPSATVAYQAIGELKGSKKIGGGFAARLARKLEGHLMASSETLDPFFDDDEVVDDGEVISDPTTGFAGASEMVMRLDRGLTKEYNEEFLSVDVATERIIEEELRGFELEDADNERPDPDPETPEDPVTP